MYSLDNCRITNSNDIWSNVLCSDNKSFQLVSCSRAEGVGSKLLLLILLILVMRMSIGVLVSYRLGATKMIPQVPATQAKLNNHNKILSSTVATYFQSSETSA